RWAGGCRSVGGRPPQEAELRRRSCWTGPILLGSPLNGTSGSGLDIARSRCSTIPSDRSLGKHGGLERAPRRLELKRLPQQVRLWLGTATLALTIASGIGLLAATPGLADSQDIALDRQAYVPDAGADAYQAYAVEFGCTTPPCPDPASIHVGATPNQSAYHSLVHIELNAIPAGDTVSSLVLTLAVNADNGSTDNVNSGPEWILDAYPLSSELPAGFSGCASSAQCSAPQADQTVSPVVGKAVTDSSGAITAFSFDVARFLPYWQNKGVNTGLAILPDAVDTTQPWTVAFNRDHDIATATVSTPSGATTVISSSASSGGGSVFTSGGSGGGGGGGASSAVVPAVVAPATVPTTGASPAPVASAVPAPKTPQPAVVVEQAASGQV